MKRIINKLIGDEKSFDLGHRVLNISLLFATIISIIGIISNYMLDLHWYTSLTVISSLLVFSFAYIFSIITAKPKVPTIVSLGFLVVFFTPFMWFANGGSSGGFQYYTLFFLAGILIITKGKIRIVLIILLGVSILSSMISEFYFPEYIIPYPSRTDRYIDVILSFFIAFIGITLYININLNQYTTANLKLNHKNKLLNQNRQEIFEHKRKIEHQKAEIEEKAHSLQELNKTKDRFFSIISHDLRSPFNSLLGLTELLKVERKSMTDKEIDKIVDLIYESSEKGYRLVLNLLEWSRAQTDQIEFNPTKIDLSKVVIENIDLVQVQSKNKGVDISFNSEMHQDCFVLADLNMLNTILRNLISNAIKYTPKGKISISGKRIQNTCELSIADTGVGISSEKLEKLFDIDRNASTTGTNGEVGTGLGLILCKEFVEKNNGKLTAKSTINKGSVFSFSLPMFKEK